MQDPLLMQLIQIVETFVGENRIEIPIVIQVQGTRLSGVLISSKNYFQLLRAAPLRTQLAEAIKRRPLQSIQVPEDSANYIHILSAEGENPSAMAWRFRLDAVEGFTLGSLVYDDAATA